ncbi:MAG: tRNA preQ1(34) S-adenosylmethionine ribosyltransferase-isomerase QueA [Armatimonadota bacterium]|nr:tRNA preQ1(34) S-adenosylmethionine ribosyltransferase-isomerase QueA [Armatimonadota bacterium]
MTSLEYTLPEKAIAQSPMEPRDASKLMVVSAQGIAHKHFYDLPSLLAPGDLVIANNTRVTALRLFGERETGGKVEALLLRETAPGTYEALTKPAKRLCVGSRISFGEGLLAEVADAGEGGFRTLRFGNASDLNVRLSEIGRLPLPPYFHGDLATDERYQTIYSSTPGSSAAPTAGLHFTHSTMEALAERDVEVAYVTLDVGIDTFRPVQAENLDDHKMHGERYDIPKDTVEAVRNAKGRIVAIGTTSVRALESAAVGKRSLRSGSGTSTLFVRTGYEFQIIDAMVTNFHMPKTTMLHMVAALCGDETLNDAYQVALANDYRFLSFGDAMLVFWPAIGE